MSEESIMLPVFNIVRHRISTDGAGVVTLVGAFGCPLACKYCINPHAWKAENKHKCKLMTPTELYDAVKIDDLYFQATNGGITFGGGEALLHTQFIAEFKKLIKENWHINVETSLHVSQKQLEQVLSSVDDFIVDIKDCNPNIYEAYTSQPMGNVLSNLEIVLRTKGPEHVWVRVPHIPNYNTDEDVKHSIEVLKNMGITQIEEFNYIT